MRRGMRVSCSRRRTEARPRFTSGTTCRGVLGSPKRNTRTFCASRRRGTTRFICRSPVVRRGSMRPDKLSDIQPKKGVIEIGSIWFGLTLRRTRSATKSMYLMLHYAMDDLGYRRMQWRCNALNTISRGQRVGLGSALGFFHNHMIFKGRNRDTAWYSILDDEWPEVREIMERWLAESNFDQDGTAKTSLIALMEERGPSRRV